MMGVSVGGGINVTVAERWPVIRTWWCFFHQQIIVTCWHEGKLIYELINLSITMCPFWLISRIDARIWFFQVVKSVSLLLFFLSLAEIKQDVWKALDGHCSVTCNLSNQSIYWNENRVQGRWFVAGVSAQERDEVETKWKNLTLKQRDFVVGFLSIHNWCYFPDINFPASNYRTALVWWIFSLTTKNKIQDVIFDFIWLSFA